MGNISSKGQKTSKLSDERKPETKEAQIAPVRAKAPSIASKKVTALQFVAITAGNAGVNLWAGKKYKHNDIRSIQQWSDEFLKEGAIDNAPDILSESRV